MSSKKLMTGLTILMVVALATIGVAYGAWTDSLTVGGSVSLGTLNVDFVGTDGPVATADEIDPLDAASCTLDYEDDVVAISIVGAYPGYQCNPKLTVTNTGSIPATGSLDFPVYQPIPGVYIGGTTVPVTLIPGASVQTTLSIDVFDPAAGGGTYAFSYVLTFTQ